MAVAREMYGHVGDPKDGKTMPRPSRDRKTARRLNLEMNGAVRDRLEQLRDRIQADSLSEVIRRSISVYDLLSEESAKGAKSYLRYPDGRERELVLEFVTPE